MTIRASWVRAAATAVVYAAVAAWLTWPLGAHVATHLPKTSMVFDTLHTAWVLSWETHSLTTAPLSLPDAGIYHPTPNALFYGQTAFGALPYFGPMLLATGNPALALNVMFLAGVALTACALHLVVHRWTGSDLAGALAAGTFLMTRWVLWEVVPTAPQYALLHLLPWIVLMTATPSRGFPLGVLLLVVLQGLVDPVYLGATMLIPLGLVAGVRIARPETRAAGVGLAVALGIAVVALSVAFATHLAVRADNPNLPHQTLWTTPMAPFTFPWGLVSCPSPTAAPSALLLLIAAGAISVAVARGAVPARRAWAHAALWTAVGVALLFKPESLPLLDMLRVPARNGIAALIGLPLLAGLAFAECARRLEGRGRVLPVALAATVAFAAYVEHRQGLADPDFARPPLPEYALIRLEPLAPTVERALAEADGPLLEVPVGAGHAAALLNARAMYRSIFHRRPLLNGYAGYYPADFPRRMVLAEQLPDRDALRELADETGLALVLVNLTELSPEARATWAQLAMAGGRDDLRFVQGDGGALLFRVTRS